MSTATASPRTLNRRYEEKFAGSRRMHDRARELFPHGVTHDLRHLEPFPVYIERAEGASKWDVDGNRLVDFWCGHGAIILGHSHPDIVSAGQRQMARGTHLGACHEREVDWGEWVKRLLPSAERMRFVASGTEATLMAIRLSRIHTGKPKVLKFVGHFHGWHDGVMPEAYAPYNGSAVPGLPPGTAAATVTLRPNDPEAVEKALATDPEIGCVILEPTGGHWGSVPVRGDYLRALREITTRHGRLLIFDEVITGFRVSPGGAQGLYGINPDLTTLAKILAGGLPGGCVAGRSDILSHLEIRPGKPKMRHPGTFNANPLSAAAGIATLQHVYTGEPVRKANATAAAIRKRLNQLFTERKAPWVAYGEFSGFKLIPGYQGPRPTTDDFVPYNGDVDKLDGPKDARLVHAFRKAMLLHGSDTWGLGGMTSAAHGEGDVETLVKAVAAAMDMLREEGLT